jgi:hypothetical protein
VSVVENCSAPSIFKILETFGTSGKAERIKVNRTIKEPVLSFICCANILFPKMETESSKPLRYNRLEPYGPGRFLFCMADFHQKVWNVHKKILSLPSITTNHWCIWTSIIHEECGNHIVFTVLPIY